MNERTEVKSHEICDFIVDNGVDILLIAETWLSTSADIVIGEIPKGNKIFHVPCKGRKRGGGVGMVFKENIDIVKQVPPRQYESFECLEILLKTGNDCVRLVTMYRPL